MLPEAPYKQPWPATIAPMRLLLLPLLLTALACNSQAGPQQSFTPEDVQALAAICTAPPYPSSYSGLISQSHGHLRELLERRRFLNATQYVRGISADPEQLRNGAALIVLLHRESHMASGVLLVLFHPAGQQDVVTVKRMIGQEVIEEELQALPVFPFHWYQADGEADFIEDALFYLDRNAQNQLVDSHGEALYYWRWGDS